MDNNRDGAYRYKAVWHTLRLIGIDRVTVAFSGEGDSGQIDDVAPTLPHDYSEEAVAAHSARSDAFREAADVPA